MSSESTAENAELKKEQVRFSALLSDDEMTALCAKYGIEDERERKLWVRPFFWLMVFSAGESSRRGSLLHLIGFFLGAMSILFPAKKIRSLTKSAVSKRLKHISWYFFRGVYNHLLAKYEKLLSREQQHYLGHFKDAFAVDGSVIALCKQVEKIFESVHEGKASLKMNTKFSLKLGVVTKLQVSSGKRHDSRFAFVTQTPNVLYIVDLGFWSFKLMQKIMAAGSFFILRLKSSCDPCIVNVAQEQYTHLIGKRLSEIGAFLATLATTSTQLDLTVQLSTTKKPHLRDNVRLVALFHEQQWRFYVTNIWAAAFTPPLLYQLYAQRWQVEIFFNIFKNVLNLENIIAKTKNGILIEIYSALIFHLFTLILIALAAQQTGRSLHEFSFERTFKVIKGFLVSHLHRFLQRSLLAVDEIFPILVEIVAAMGLAQHPHDDFTFQARFPT
jgi:hypothetical protein